LLFAAADCDGGVCVGMTENVAAENSAGLVSRVENSGIEVRGVENVA